MRLYELHLREVAEPYPPLAELARKYADRYRALEKVLLPCLSRAFPEGRVVGENFVIPLGKFGPKTTDGTATASGGDNTNEMVEFLRRWGARDVDPRANTLVWWDGRKLRIGRALTLIEELSQRADWREYEVARRQRWIEGRQRRGLSLPPDPEKLLEFPDRLPSREEIDRWRRALEQGTRKGARAERSGGLVAVVSFDAVENAHRSARRGWTSCYDPEGYKRPDYAWNVVECSLENADVMVWLTREADTERLERPIGRTAMRVYGHSSRQAVQLDTDEAYGDLPEWWDDWVREVFVSRVNRQCGAEAGTYRRFGAILDYREWDPEDRVLVPPSTAEQVERAIFYLARGGEKDPAIEELLRDDPSGLLRTLANRGGHSEVVDLVRRIAENQKLRKALRKVLTGERETSHPFLALLTVLEDPQRLDPMSSKGRDIEAILWGIAHILDWAGDSPEIGHILRKPENTEILARALVLTLGEQDPAGDSLLRAGVIRLSPFTALVGLVSGTLGWDTAVGLVPGFRSFLRTEQAVRTLLERLQVDEDASMENVVRVLGEMSAAGIPESSAREVLHRLLQTEHAIYDLKLTVEPSKRPNYVHELVRLIRRYGAGDGILSKWEDLLTEENPFEAEKKLPDRISRLGLSASWYAKYTKRIAAELSTEELAEIIQGIADKEFGSTDAVSDVLTAVASRPDLPELLDRLLRGRNWKTIAAVLKKTKDPRFLTALVQDGRFHPDLFRLFPEIAESVLWHLATQGHTDALLWFLWELYRQNRNTARNILSPLNWTERTRTIARAVTDALVGGRSPQVERFARGLPPDDFLRSVCGHDDTEAILRIVELAMRVTPHGPTSYVYPLVRNCRIGFDRLLSEKGIVGDATVRWIDQEYKKAGRTRHPPALVDQLADALRRMAPAAVAHLASRISEEAFVGLVRWLALMAKCEPMRKVLFSAGVLEKAQEALRAVLQNARYVPCLTSTVRTVAKSPQLDEFLGPFVENFDRIKDPELLEELRELVATVPSGGANVEKLRHLLGPTTETEA